MCLSLLPLGLGFPSTVSQCEQQLILVAEGKTQCLRAVAAHQEDPGLN